jgi:hypothetical protein
MKTSLDGEADVTARSAKALVLLLLFLRSGQEDECKRIPEDSSQGH